MCGSPNRQWTLLLPRFNCPAYGAELCAAKYRNNVSVSSGSISSRKAQMSRIVSQMTVADAAAAAAADDRVGSLVDGDAKPESAALGWRDDRRRGLFEEDEDEGGG